MMMFLDYKPQTNNTCAFAPKLPTGWSTMTFNNLLYKNQRFNVTVSETGTSTSANINKLTSGALNYDLWLRIPGSETPAIVITNGARTLSYTYDSAARRVRVQGPLSTAAGLNAVTVTFGSADSDGDGLTDAQEANVLGSDPLNADTDSDGMSDGFENQYFGSPTAGDPNADPDGDGQNNLAEAMTGTVPTDAASALRIMNVTRQPNGDILVTAASVSGKKYVLLASTNFATYVPVSTTNTAVGATISFTDPSPGEGAKVYKVQYVP
jgi:hypothetical protein